MSRHQNQAKALLDAWDVVVRFRWQFILPTFLVAVGVLTASLLLPRKYKAVAIFERRMDTVMEEITMRGGTATYTRQPTGLAYEIAGEVAIDQMLSDIEPQISELAAERGKPIDLVNLRRELQSKVLVRRDVATKSLDRVRVTFTGQDPQTARLAVNTLVSNYIDRTRRELDQRLAQSEAFFEAEANRSRKLIDKLENEKLTFEIAHVDLLPENPNNVQATLADAQLRNTELVDLAEAAKLRAEALSRSLERTPETIGSFVRTRNPELDRLERELTKHQDRLNDYLTVRKMRSEHPDLIDLRAQIQELKLKAAQIPAEIVSEQRVTKNPKYAELELMLTQAAAEAEALESQWASSTTKIDELNSESTRIFPVRAQYSKMDRQIDQALRQLAFWESNLNRVNMSLTAETGNRGIQLTFVKPCGAITRPVSPDLLHVLMAAVGLGMVSGGVSVLFSHRTNESFLTGEELSKAVSVPLLGSVSEVSSAHQRRMKRIRQLVIAPVNLAGMTVVLLVMVGLLYSNLRQPEVIEHTDVKSNETIQQSAVTRPATDL